MKPALEGQYTYTQMRELMEEAKAKLAHLQQERDHLRMAAESEAKRGDELAARVIELETAAHEIGVEINYQRHSDLEIHEMLITMGAALRKQAGESDE